MTARFRIGSMPVENSSRNIDRDVDHEHLRDLHAPADPAAQVLNLTVGLVGQPEVLHHRRRRCARDRGRERP